MDLASVARPSRHNCVCRRLPGEHLTGCVSSPIIFKFSMKIIYGNLKLSVVFCVGRRMVTMVSRDFVEIAKIVS